MIYFTSDVHVGHANIIKYSNRPYSSVDEMNEQLIQNWNSIVTKEDDVWSLGDFSFMNFDKTINFIRRLNYRSFNMVLGNHCKDIRNRQRAYLDSKLVNSIQEYKEITVEGQHIVLFHYGCRVWNRVHRGSWLLYGHSHGTLPPYGKSVDVGVDAPFVTGMPEYRPYSFEEVRRFMNKQDAVWGDQHGTSDDKN